MTCDGRCAVSGACVSELQHRIHLSIHDVVQGVSWIDESTVGTAEAILASFWERSHNTEERYDDKQGFQRVEEQLVKTGPAEEEANDSFAALLEGLIEDKVNLEVGSAMEASMHKIEELLSSSPAQCSPVLKKESVAWVIKRWNMSCSCRFWRPCMAWWLKIPYTNTSRTGKLWRHMSRGWPATIVSSPRSPIHWNNGYGRHHQATQGRTTRM